MGMLFNACCCDLCSQTGPPAAHSCRCAACGWQWHCGRQWAECSGAGPGGASGGCWPGEAECGWRGEAHAGGQGHDDGRGQRRGQGNPQEAECKAGQARTRLSAWSAVSSLHALTGMLAQWQDFTQALM